MKVVVVSGLWPPDVGGPASSAPEAAAFLHARRHEVRVVTTAAAAPARAPYPVEWVSRSLLPGARHAAFAATLARAARAADVVYTQSVLGRSAVACTVARTPFVVKLPDDPAFERARRRGLFAGGLDEFQSARGVRIDALRRARTVALHHAAHVLTPSAYLRGLVLAWGVAPERVTVLPNPAPRAHPSDGERHGFVLAGRLNAQKDVATALDALARVDGPNLTVVGDGPDRTALELRARELGLNGRVRFLGPQPRERVLELFAAAEAVVLSSAWENFPHVLVEALAVGTPVIATRVGGVAEIVEDGRNGILVPPKDVDALAGALERFAVDAELRSRLAASAAPSVERFGPDRIYAELERILEAAAR